MSTLYVLPSLSECVRTRLSRTVHETSRQFRDFQTFTAGSRKNIENPRPKTRNTLKNAARQPAACNGDPLLREIARCDASSGVAGFAPLQTPPSPTAPTT